MHPGFAPANKHAQLRTATQNSHSEPASATAPTNRNVDPKLETVAGMRNCNPETLRNQKLELGTQNCFCFRNSELGTRNSKLL